MKQILENTKVLLLISCVSIFLAIGGLSFALYIKWHTPVKDDNTQRIAYLDDDLDNAEDKEEKEVLKFHMEVKGAVKKPGVYEVTEHMLLQDVVKLAGGFKSTAYTDNINLSRKVSNEMVLYVFTKSAYKAKKTVSTSEIKKQMNAPVCNSSTYDIENCLENASSEIVPGTTDTKPNEEIKENQGEKNTLVNINTASEKELVALSGIGESKAKSIVAYRSEHGPFKALEDIKNVSGIGDAVYEQIKNNITI